MIPKFLPNRGRQSPQQKVITYDTRRYLPSLPHFW